MRRFLPAAFVIALSGTARAAVIKEYPLAPDTFPNFITAGSDGRMWFTEAGADQLGAFDANGSLTVYPVATAGCVPVGIAAVGKYLWYTCTGADKVGYMDVSGAGMDYTATPRPAGPIAADGEWRLWYTGGDDSIVRLFGPTIHSGVAGSTFFGIAFGPIGYFLDAAITNTIYVTDTAHAHFVVIESLRDAYAGYQDLTGPAYLVAVCDGFPWFTLPGQDFIEEYDGTGHAPNDSGGSVEGVACGPDGSIWYTDAGTNRIGRLKPDHLTIESFPVPTAGATPYGIAVGPDGSVWFTENTAHKVGRLWLHPPGDVNGDGTTDVADVFFLINFLFAGGPPPVP